MPDRPQYIEGFLFSPDLSRATLIREWIPVKETIRLKGVGRELAAAEDPAEAMRLEFQKQTGINVPKWDWFLRLSGNGYVKNYFRAIGDAEAVVSQGDEQVHVIFSDSISRYKTAANLGWIIPLAMDGTVNFTESTEP